MDEDRRSDDDAETDSEEDERKPAMVVERNSSKPKQGSTPKSQAVTYRIDVLTGKDGKAGTDSNVSIKLVGANGASAEHKLDNNTVISKQRNKFEKGQVDVFQIEEVDLGALKELNVQIDGSGYSSN
jgi:hypothetical protein